MNCPICNKRYEIKWYNENGVATGSDLSCPRCDYIDEDYYGQYRIEFCGNRWQWSYNTPYWERNEIEKEIAIVIKNNKGKPQFWHRKLRYYKHEIEVPF